MIACWEDGGSEPIYVCESHANQLGRPRERRPDVRVITAPSDDGADAIKSEERVVVPFPNSQPLQVPAQIQEIVATKPKRFVASRATRNLAAAKAEQTTADVPVRFPVRSDHSDNPIENEDRPPTQEVVVAKPKRSAASEALRNVVAVTKAELPIADAPARSAVRDLSYGNPAKAMVDEAIWNLATGNYQVYKTALQQGSSAAEAAQAAGEAVGRGAGIARSQRLHALNWKLSFSESRAIIGLAEAVDKPLENAVLKIISSGELSDLQKDAAIEQLGALQKWVKHGLQGNVTPLQTNQIILAIGDRLNWGGIADVSEDLKPVYRALYASLKSAILIAAPEAQNFHDRLYGQFVRRQIRSGNLLTTTEFATHLGSF